MKLTKAQRKALHDKYKGHCAYCGCELHDIWHADHLKPIVRNGNETCLSPENDTIENMMPSCPSCNMIKNSFTLEQFRENIQNFVRSLNNYDVQYKFAKKFGLIEETGKSVKFYFERKK